MNNKITFPELVDAIAELTNTSKRVSEQFLKELFGVIKERLEQGETVKVKGLGVFKVNEIASRKSVNVNTGEEMEIPSHRRVSFTPDKSLAEAINMPFEGFETVILDDDLSEEELNALAAVDDEPQSDEDNVQQEEIEAQPKVAEPAEVEEPQPPVFVEREEPEVDNEPPVIPPIKEPEAEDSVPEQANDEEEKDDISTLDEDSDDKEYEITYDAEEMHSAKRYSFVWGLLAGVLVATIGFAVFYYYVLNPSHAVKDELELVAVDSDTVTIPEKEAVVLPEQDSADVKVEVPKVQSVVTDTIREYYFLTKMARKYYGRYEFWVYIYEENKDKISDPHHVSPGLVVVIPPAEKYGIDKDNPESVNKAKEKAAKLQ